MPNILDLPWEIFEGIYKHVIEDGDSYLWAMWTGARDSPPGTRTMTAKLRLVCRQWADWLYVHYLYHTITFGSASRALRFTKDQIARRSKNLPRARCHSLQVIEILTWGPPPVDKNTPGLGISMKLAKARTRKPNDTITSEILEGLIELFTDSIVKLNLRFWHVMSLPASTIEKIGRIENLRTMTLGHELPETLPGPPQPLYPLYHNSSDEELEQQLRRGEVADDDEDEPPTEMDPVKSKIDSDCLKSLILATRNLQSLDISDLDPICLPKPISSSLSSHQILPTITHLDVNLEGQSLARLVDLSIALKGTLKVLSLKDQYGNNPGRMIVPVFENLRESLEGLFVPNDKILKPVARFQFPKLRVFKTISWDGPIANLLEKPMISQSPIEVLALRADIVDRKPKTKFLVNPFSNLPSLKRLLFYDVSPGYSAPPAYTEACAARCVECVYLSTMDSENVSLIMKL
ncbi:hypothetical protein PTTG_06320 [Puccinia triticina 1-1 BBBD Race 1]|uniref:F-box domain-containing protein n=2 Tax=Puccinia triticina TaxID=208348 RepID=A0A180GU90_PUCT1|nr:uncharacterized protein PtA15_3A147 [Puccinia triticina]OAV96325.1 hypothetical protein PTTG_06320 [Puccinia triticina 1-1 BBBD Race 1]WAQ82783.1 hypothetical protein PtA15_3A147 [Puccinia triticina]